MLWYHCRSLAADCPSTLLFPPRGCKSLQAGGIHMASLAAQMVKNPPAMQETWVRSLGWEDPLEKEMATHSSTLAWGISWTGKPGGL